MTATDQQRLLLTSIGCYRQADTAQRLAQTTRDQVRFMDNTNDCKRPSEAAINKHRLQQILLETSIDCQRSSEIDEYYNWLQETRRDFQGPAQTARYCQRLALMNTTVTASIQQRLLLTCIDCYRPTDIARDQQRPLRDQVRLLYTILMTASDQQRYKHRLQQILLETK